MFVTIIADASYDAQHLVGGYGYWIACERGKRPGGGPLKGNVLSSNHAEMMAICNALHDGVKHGLIQAGDEVLIQTDCLGAIDALRKSVMPPEGRHANKTIYHVYNGMLIQHRLTVRFKHVKGHTSRPEPRYAANRMCDKRAKEGMRAERSRRVNHG